MNRVNRVVARSQGRIQFLPLRDVWAISGTLADTFPLDRRLTRGPRWARRLSNWTRLVLVDRAVTDPGRTAVLTMHDTPWVPAVVVAVLAAVVAPRVPRWMRVALFGSAVAWAVRGRRASRFLVMQRELQRLAPGGILVADFVALEPGAGMRWGADVLDRIGDEFSFVALLPSSGDDRRDAARERLYVRRLGFRRVGETGAGGQSMTILVRDRAGQPSAIQSSARTPRSPNHASSATQSAR